MSWDDDDRKVTVEINGESISVPETSEFTRTVRVLKRAKGWGKIRVYVDGREIDSDEAPATFAGIGTVKITRYDEVG